MSSFEANTTDVRLVRVLLPASLIREVDQLVLSGQGGYDSRQEFFAEAIQNQVVEVKHGATDEGQLLLARDLGPHSPVPQRRALVNGSGTRVSRTTPPDPDDAHTLPAALAEGDPIDQLSDLAQTALAPVERGAVVEDGHATFKHEPLFGLHNRDYPSLWALTILGRMTADGPAPASQVYAETTRQAWRFANSLALLEKKVPGKPTAMFPTNTAKPQSAEEGFRAFALGSINRKPTADGMFETAGPLYSWQVVQLNKGENGTPRLGLTAAGWDLVDAMAGLTLDWPHAREFSERFFAHLCEYAPWDWMGFEQLLSFTQERPTRKELAAQFGQWQPTWSEAMQNTNAAGFVARAREWGLLEAKLVDGRYALTEYGESMLRDRSAA